MRVTAAESCASLTACSGQPASHGQSGILIYVDGDTLSMYASDRQSPVAIPVSSITRLEVYRGQKGSVGGAAKGAGIGALLGAALGAAVGGTTEAIFGGMLGRKRDYGDAVAEGATRGVVEGAFTGAMIGAAAGDAVWHEVTVHQLREELCHCRIPERPAGIT